MDRSAGNIGRLFDGIAGDYDRLNHILSLGVDKLWRRRAVKEVADASRPLNILDLACGTGDFTIEIARNSNYLSNVIGVDISEEMLRIMNRKALDAGLSGLIKTEVGDAEQLRFADGSFDRVTIAFGIRNFAHREAALKEIFRVLRPGGRLVILELSVPSCKFAGWLYKLYLTKILPKIGGKISGNLQAYQYLASSIVAFPDKDEWMKTMRDLGYFKVGHKAYSLGICRMYTATK